MLIRFVCIGWVFGCIERNTRKVRMVEVAQRNADTLLPIIADWIAPGTLVVMFIANIVFSKNR